MSAPPGRLAKTTETRQVTCTRRDDLSHLRPDTQHVSETLHKCRTGEVVFEKVQLLMRPNVYAIGSDGQVVEVRGGTADLDGI